MRLLRWLSRLWHPPLTLTEQMRALWGTETTATILHAEADDAKVRIKRRMFGRRAA